MLREIKLYLSKVKSADTASISRELNQDRELVQIAVNELLAKKSIIKEEREKTCSGCSCSGSCHDNETYYMLNK